MASNPAVLGPTAVLARFAAALNGATLPPELVERVGYLVIDLLGCIIRANVDSPAAPALKASVRKLGLGDGIHTVFGDAGSWSLMGAAFLNAALGHALDFDDTHAPSTLHPGAPVIPAAIAAAEQTDASGTDIVAAIVAGYETICRIGLALPAGDHYARGFHPTATCGVFGAAVAAGRVFGLDAVGIESAMGIALSQSAGSLQFLVDGAWTKPFQVGWAAMSGLSAASFAREGYRGPSEALEGRHGFLQAYAPAPHPERIVRDLGRVYETMATGIKPYPSCRYGHAGIDAILALRAEYGLRPAEVERITYGLSRAGLLLVGQPAELKQDPRNLVAAQFSAPFVLSMALATGAMAWDSYERLYDPEIRALLTKVDCVHDPEIEAEFPANMSGKVTIRAGGRDFVRTVIVPLGEPSNFLDRRALLGKFSDLARSVLQDRTEMLADAALSLSTIPSARRFTELGSGLID